MGFGSVTFGNNSLLKTLVLRKTSDIITAYVNSFSSSGITSADARIYVPQNLISQYQQATNWSALYANNPNLFQPLEGSPYENPNYDVATLLAS